MCVQYRSVRTFTCRTYSGDGYEAAEAQQEADEVRKGRITALMTALDKAKLFLRHQMRDDRVNDACIVGSQ